MMKVLTEKKKIYYSNYDNILELLEIIYASHYLFFSMIFQKTYMLYNFNSIFV